MHESQFWSKVAECFHYLESTCGFTLTRHSSMLLTYERGRHYITVGWDRQRSYEASVEFGLVGRVASFSLEELREVIVDIPPIESWKCVRTEDEAEAFFCEVARTARSVLCGITELPPELYEDLQRRQAERVKARLERARRKGEQRRERRAKRLGLK